MVNGIPSNWITVTMNTETGDITANGGHETLAKFTMDRVPGKDPTRKWHFVEQQIGGTWEEASGGNVKFTFLDSAQMDTLWKEVYAKEVYSMWKEVGAKTWTSESSSMTAGSQGTPDTPKRKSATRSYHVGGIAEWQSKVFVMQGIINDAVMVVDKDSGQVVLNLRQSKCGKNLKFYEANNVKKGLSIAEYKVAHEKTLCGIREVNDDNSSGKMHLHLSPAFLSKLPVSLFAMAAMYSSFTLNDMDPGSCEAAGLGSMDPGSF